MIPNATTFQNYNQGNCDAEAKTHTRTAEGSPGLLNRTAKSQIPFLDDLHKLERLLGISIEATTNLTYVALRELIVAREFGVYNDDISRLPAFWDEG